MSVKSSRVVLGTAARSMDLLDSLGVTERHVQATIDDPIRRAVVASAYKGSSSLFQVSFDDILAREINFLTIFHQTMDQTMFWTKLVEQALRQAESVNGSITVNDRFIPGNLTLQTLFQFIYNWNAEQVKAGQSPLKLYNEQGKEWWRSNKDVKSIPTKFGIITCDFQTVMKSTDMVGRPFNLGIDDQIVWANEQGGDGIMSAEEVVYLFIRSLIENQLPLWGGGSIRCRNTCGSDSLYVYFNAGLGFSVAYCDRGEQYQGLSALPEVFLEFGL